VRTISFPSGETVPVLGQGTWNMGENPAMREQEIAALRTGLELGMTLIDTAEIYADGGSESVVGEAIDGQRDGVFLVSKVHPLNATSEGTIQACEASLKRLGTDRLDLYLLHWRESVPLEETLGAFEQLVDDGKIRYFGVSCFDVADMEEAWSLPGGSAAIADQVLYNLTKRGIEFNLLPWCKSREVPVMAYSPVGQGSLAVDGALEAVASRHGVTKAQVALAWVLRQEGVLAIPKAASIEHVKDNVAALEIVLDVEDLAAIDEAFPAPTQPTPLEIFQ
jgi:diketogulonate reductase-like aldo/keto reductase